MEESIFFLIIFLFGIVVGSFLNVCILRLPLGEEVVKKHSHCMSCGYKLLWFDMIPVLSWLMLKGHCRRCREAISIQYPLVELANGFLWLGIAETKGISVTGLCYCIASSSLLVLSIIDWRTYEIPLGCNAVIFLCGFVNAVFHRQDRQLFLIGLICISSLLLLLFMISRGNAIGGGDIKLMAAAGLLLGWKNIALAFVTACISGSVFHFILMKVKGKDHMLAFGPYLSFGIWGSMMWGEQLVAWYMDWILS